MISTATIRGPYRYSLTRSWDITLPTVLWIMLNPSTADAHTDDPTLRKCIGFSKRWEFGGLEVVNLFALRATNPAELRNAADPVGRLNAEYLTKALAVSTLQMVMVAWGGSVHVKQHDSIVHRLLVGQNVRCLGRTKNKSPKHPLYVPYSKFPEVFE